MMRTSLGSCVTANVPSPPKVRFLNSLLAPMSLLSRPMIGTACVSVLFAPNMPTLKYEARVGFGQLSS
jgi:hypothetical protein